MVFFAVIVVVALAAVAYVLWQMKDDQELLDATAEPVLAKDLQAPILGKEKKSGAGLKFNLNVFNKNSSDNPISQNPPLIDAVPRGKKNFFDVFKLGKKQDLNFDVPRPTPISSLKEALEIEKKLKEKQALKGKATFKDAPMGGTAGIKVQPPAEEIKPAVVKENPALSPEEEKKLEAELDSTLQLSEVKEKYEKLDKLFKEKSEQLDYLQKSLDNELKNKKEFNKVKDILEKELKEQKDRNRDVQAALTASNNDNESQKKRIEQLDQKIDTLQKDVLAKEKEVDELLKRLHTFASPQTAATPPVKIAPVVDDVQAPVVEPEIVTPKEPEISAPEAVVVAEASSEIVPVPADVSNEVPVVVEVKKVDEPPVEKNVVPENLPAVEPVEAVAVEPLKTPEDSGLSQEQPKEEFLILKPDVLSSSVSQEPDAPVNPAPEQLQSDADANDRKPAIEDDSNSSPEDGPKPNNS